MPDWPMCGQEAAVKPKPQASLPMAISSASGQPMQAGGSPGAGSWPKSPIGPLPQDRGEDWDEEEDMADGDDDGPSTGGGLVACAACGWAGRAPLPSACWGTIACCRSEPGQEQRQQDLALAQCLSIDSASGPQPALSAQRSALSPQLQPSARRGGFSLLHLLQVPGAAAARARATLASPASGCSCLTCRGSSGWASRKLLPAWASVPPLSRFGPSAAASGAVKLPAVSSALQALRLHPASALSPRQQGKCLPSIPRACVQRACRRHGIQRWPRRQLLKLSRAIDQMGPQNSDAPSGLKLQQQPSGGGLAPGLRSPCIQRCSGARASPQRVMRARAQWLQPGEAPCAGLELSSADPPEQQPSSDRRWTQLAQLIPDLRTSSGNLPQQQDLAPRRAPPQAEISTRSRRPTTRSWAGSAYEQHSASAAGSPSTGSQHQGAQAGCR